MTDPRSSNGSDDGLGVMRVIVAIATTIMVGAFTAAGWYAGQHMGWWG